MVIKGRFVTITPWLFAIHDPVAFVCWATASGQGYLLIVSSSGTYFFLLRLCKFFPRNRQRQREYTHITHTVPSKLKQTRNKPVLFTISSSWTWMSKLIFAQLCRNYEPNTYVSEAPTMHPSTKLLVKQHPLLTDWYDFSSVFGKTLMSSDGIRQTFGRACVVSTFRYYSINK